MGDRLGARVVLACACLLSAAAMISYGHAAAAPAVRDPIGSRVLENGLHVVWEEDHRQPLVALEVRIAGGLRGEGPYVGTGITHAVEHMLFKGTPTRPPGTLEQEVRRYGGTINAFTSFDTTGVSLFVESRYLKEALALLADILQHAIFDPVEFEKERAVIVSEIQMNLDDPERRLQQAFWSRHVLAHPYRHPILGYQPLLERLTVQDLAALYAAQYAPQHVTIACVGDIEGASLVRLIEDLYGGWPRGRSDPAHQVVIEEPLPASAKRVTVEQAVQTAYVLLGFASVRLHDPALYPLDVLANILGQGRSSRLYETVVRQRRLAHAIAAWNYTPYDPGIFAIQLRTDPDKVDAALQAVLEVLEAVRAQGVTEAELRKAARGVSAEYLFSLQTIEAKAADLATSTALTGDPGFSRQYVVRISQVTAEEVQAAARRVLDAARMTTAVIRPPATDTPVRSMPTAAMAMTKTVLPNGATALIGVDRTLPIAAVVVAFRGGVRVETDQTQGLSSLVARLLIKGTPHKTAAQIARQVESLGGSLEPFSGRDGLGLVLQVLAPDVPEGVSLIHELLTQSAFPEEELALERALITNQLEAQEDEIVEVGGRLLRSSLFATHPYRFHPLGDVHTIATLTRRQCRRFAAQWLVPANLVVAVAGDVDEQAVARQLTATFGAMPAGASDWPASLAEPQLDGVRETARTMEKEQALVMLGFRGSSYRAPDRDALDVLTAILSGMSGRLFQAVREARGLSYTLGAVHVPAWDPGYLLIYAATRPQELDHVLRALEQQLALVVANGVTAEEVAQAQRYLIGAHRMDVQHLVGLAKRTALDELYDLGYDAWHTYEDRINAVTAEQIHEAAARYLTLRRRAQVLISPNGLAAP
jgi:zinc protease